MNESIEELASLYVLDQLDPSVRASFEARLREDKNLAALVQQLETALAARIHALPRREPPADLISRIEARIDALPEQNVGIESHPVKSASRATASTSFPRRYFAPWAVLGGIAALVLIGIGAVGSWALRSAASDSRPIVIIAGLDSQRSTLAELPFPAASSTSEARFIQLASLAEQFWDRPEKLPVKFSSTNGRAYAVFDPASNQGFIAVQALAPVPTGARYHLWLLDTGSGQLHDAGVLPPNASTRGLFFFSVPDASRPHDNQVTFFITEERTADGQTSTPRGPVVLGSRPI